MTKAGSARPILTSPLADLMLADVAAPECPARNAIRPPRTTRRGCRMALSRMPSNPLELPPRPEMVQPRHSKNVLACNLVHRLPMRKDGKVDHQSFTLDCNMGDAVTNQLLSYIAILVSTVACAYPHYVAAQSDACADGYVWREAFDGDHVCVSPASRAQAQFDNANAPQRRATGTPAVPLPPAKLGCHAFRAGEWREIPCATPEETSRMPRPEVSIESRSRLFSFSGGGGSYRPPLKFAKFDIDLLSDPAVGSVIDMRSAGKCRAPYDKARNTPNSFSVQLNTNVFDTKYGQFGGGTGKWVQFVLQTPAADDDPRDGLCVWKVDLEKQGYDNSACVFFKRDKNFLGAGADRRRKSIQVIGLIQRSETGASMLTAVAGVPWNDPELPFGSAYAVGTTDTINGKYIGLDDKTEYPLGLSEADNWWQATGGIYGQSCWSQAQFKDTRFHETLAVSTCNPNDSSCLSAPMTPFSLPYYAIGLLRLTPYPPITGESSNLVAGLNSLHYINYSCPHSTQCVSWGWSHSP
jgi:hypothetical protein